MCFKTCHKIRLGQKLQSVSPRLVLRQFWDCPPPANSKAGEQGSIWNVAKFRLWGSTEKSPLRKKNKSGPIWRTASLVANTISVLHVESKPAPALEASRHKRIAKTGSFERTFIPCVYCEFTANSVQSQPQYLPKQPFKFAELGHTIQMRQQLYSCQHLYCYSCGFPLFCFTLPQEALGFLCFVLPAGRSTVLPSTRPYNEIHSQMSKQAHTEMQQIVTVHPGEPSCR